MQMFTRITKSLLLFAACAMTSFAAAPPVASVMGTAPIDVDGIRTPARTLVPVAVGDDVVTQSGAAFVQFRDGSNVVLQPESELQIQGQPGQPSVRILKGSATYDLVPTSKLRVTNSKGETINQILDNALPAGGPAINRVTGPLSEAVVYRSSPSRQVGFMMPDSFAMTGTFVLAAGGPGAAAGASGTSIITPSGLTINLTPVLNSSGQVTGFTVASITTTVTLPNGTTATITATTGVLIGATVSGVTSTTQTGTQVSIQFTPPGSTTPLTPTQAATAVQTMEQIAVNTAINNGSLPPGTQPPSPSPVSTGQFSSSAP